MALLSDTRQEKRLSPGSPMSRGISAMWASPMRKLEEYPENVVLDSRQGVAIEYLVGKAG